MEASEGRPIKVCEESAAAQMLISGQLKLLESLQYQAAGLYIGHDYRLDFTYRWPGSGHADGPPDRPRPSMSLLPAFNVMT